MGLCRDERRHSPTIWEEPVLTFAYFIDDTVEISLEAACILDAFVHTRCTVKHLEHLQRGPRRQLVAGFDNCRDMLCDSRDT